MKESLSSVAKDIVSAHSGYLSVVVKVSELSLPAHKRIGVAHGETKLKPHHSKL